MIRAGIFIGVARSGGLDVLQDAVGGARRMHQWAVAQGIPDGTHAKLITDEGSQRVTPDQIFDAIHTIVSEGAGLDQLILYFAGHGVNLNRAEQWLLSEAPARSNAAVNVTGSVELARYCGVGHVVVISDACRVAAEGIQAQNIRGQDVFPNDFVSDRAKPVDQFFACLLGKPSAEVRDPRDAAQAYRALYTSALADALEGRCPEILENAPGTADPARYLKPVSLETYLEAEIPRRINEAQLAGRLNQDPDAIIVAHPYWISRVLGERAAATVPPGQIEPSLTRSPFRGPSSPSSATPPRAGPSKASLTKDLLMLAMLDPTQLTTGAAARDTYTRSAGQRLPSEADIQSRAEVLDRIPRLAFSFGPDQFETQCGFKIRGARVTQAFSPQATADVLGGDVVRVNLRGKSAASVLVQFEDGSGTVVPALQNFIAAITVEDRQIIDIAYEPSANTSRYEDWLLDKDDLLALRALAAEASNQGRFRLDGKDAMTIARRMQRAKGVDPTLSIYAAYAYHELQTLDSLREMSRFQQQDLHVHLFDVALLSRELIGARVTPDHHVVPFVPVLAQGWSLLNAMRFQLHPALSRLAGTLRESLWSLYSPEGVGLLRAALASGDVL